MIQSHEKPAIEVEKGSKVVVRYNIKETIVTDEMSNDTDTLYTYEEMVFDKGVAKEIRDARVAKAELSLKMNEAQEYLDTTDWHVTRYKETGVEIPAEVLAKRQECRELL